jgi:hypothetical protein
MSYRGTAACFATRGLSLKEMRGGGGVRRFFKEARGMKSPSLFLNVQSWA